MGRIQTVRKKDINIQDTFCRQTTRHEHLTSTMHKHLDLATRRSYQAQTLIESY